MVGQTLSHYQESGELFYRSGDKMMVATIETRPTLQVGTPRVLLEGAYASGFLSISPASYDVTPDGQRFVMVREKRVPRQLQLVLNWFEQLTRLAQPRVTSKQSGLPGN